VKRLDCLPYFVAEALRKQFKDVPGDDPEVYRDIEIDPWLAEKVPTTPGAHRLIFKNGHWFLAEIGKCSTP